MVTGETHKQKVQNLSFTFAAMKFFAFIMAFLVLALSVMPCADQNDALNDHEQKNIITKRATSNSHQQADDCSPFCQCSCCAGFSLNQSLAVASQPLLSLSGHQTSFIHSGLFSIALPIWQPPQLV